MISRFIRKRSLVLLSFLFFFGQQAFATYLTIDGSSTIDVKVEKDMVHIHGVYEIENRGDEIAKNVFPSLQMGTWKWAASPKTLDPKQKASWALDEQFPPNRLNCSPDDCPGENLPIRGLFPLLVLRNYQDVNGYAFASASVEHKVVGDLNADALYVTRIPPLQARFSLTGNGKDFKGTVEIRNTSSSPKRISMFYFSSPELEVLTRPSTFEVPANSTDYRSVHLRNFKGLPGSTYIAYAILQWQEKEIRDSVSIAAPVSVIKVKNTLGYLLAAVGTLVAAILLAYFFVLRKAPSKN